MLLLLIRDFLLSCASGSTSTARLPWRLFTYWMLSQLYHVTTVSFSQDWCLGTWLCLCHITSWYFTGISPEGALEIKVPYKYGPDGTQKVKELPKPDACYMMQVLQDTTGACSTYIYCIYSMYAGGAIFKSPCWSLVLNQQIGCHI